MSKITSRSSDKCKGDRFCFICTEYVKKSLRKSCKFTSTKQYRYKKVFEVENIPSLNESFAGSLICKSCDKGLSAFTIKGQPFKFREAAKWHKPTDHSKCFVCQTDFNDISRKFNGEKCLNVVMPTMSQNHPKSKTSGSPLTSKSISHNHSKMEKSSPSRPRSLAHNKGLPRRMAPMKPMSVLKKIKQTTKKIEPTERLTRSSRKSRM